MVKAELEGNKPDVQKPAEKKKRPFFRKLSLKGAENDEAAFDRLVEKLRELGVYQEDLLYRGFDGSRADIVRQLGTDTPKRKSIWAFPEQEARRIIEEGNSDEGNPIQYAYDHKKPAISIYRPNYFVEGIDFDRYKIKPDQSSKDALVGVFLLEG